MHSGITTGFVYCINDYREADFLGQRPIKPWSSVVFANYSGYWRDWISGAFPNVRDWPIPTCTDDKHAGVFYTTGMLIEDKLPTTIEELQAMCLQQQLTINEKERWLKSKDSHIDYLEERLSLLLSKRYQSSSEQLNQLQAQLFDESELEQAIQDAQAALDEAQAESSNHHATDSKRAKKTPKRETLPAHLRRVEVIIDVSDEDKHMMGDD